MIKYTTSEYFIDNFGSKIPEEDINRFLKKAQNEVESFCANRILTTIRNYLGFKFDEVNKENLSIVELNNLFEIFSDYEIEKIQDTICEYACFLFENEDVLNSVVTSMSANGATVSFTKEDVENLKYKTLSNMNNTRFRNAIA